MGLLPILLAFTWAGNKFAWGSWEIIGLMIFGAAVIILFILNEKREAEPVLSPDLFKNYIFTVSLIIGLLISVGLFGGFLISKTGKYKLQAILGAAVMIFGTYLLAVMDVNTTWHVVVRDMVILGLGVGSIMPLINVVVQNAFHYKIMGVVNSTQQFVRSLGGVIVAPIFATILANDFKSSLSANIPAKLNQMLMLIPADKKAEFFNPQSLTNLHAQEAMKSKFLAFGSGGAQLFNEFIEVVKKALTYGFNHIYTVSIFFAVAVFIAAFFLKEINLKHDEYFKEN